MRSEARNLRRIDEPRPSERAGVDIGEVVRAEGELVVRVAGGLSPASRAASCLLRPEEGDRVLVGGVADELWIIAVLQREGDVAQRLEFEGDAILVSKGRLRLAAQEGVELTTAGEMSLVSRAFRLRAAAADIVVEKIGVVATHVESVVERIAAHLKRSYRRIEEMESVVAERLDFKAKKTLTMRSEDLLVASKELVKVDAAQIHLG